MKSIVSVKNKRCKPKTEDFQTFSELLPQQYLIQTVTDVTDANKKEEKNV